MSFLITYHMPQHTQLPARTEHREVTASRAQCDTDDVSDQTSCPGVPELALLPVCKTFTINKHRSLVCVNPCRTLLFYAHLLRVGVKKPPSIYSKRNKYDVFLTANQRKSTTAISKIEKKNCAKSKTVTSR